MRLSRTYLLTPSWSQHIWCLHKSLVLELSSQRHLKVSGKSSQIQDHPRLHLRSGTLCSLGRVFSSYNLGSHIWTQRVPPYDWSLCLRAVSFSCLWHQGGYPPGMAFLSRIWSLGKASSRLGLGLVHKVCEDTFVVERMLSQGGEQTGQPMLSKYSHASSRFLGLGLITFTNILIQRIAIG